MNMNGESIVVSLLRENSRLREELRLERERSAEFEKLAQDMCKRAAETYRTTV